MQTGRKARIPGGERIVADPKVDTAVGGKENGIARNETVLKKSATKTSGARNKIVAIPIAVNPISAPNRNDPSGAGASRRRTICQTTNQKTKTRPAAGMRMAE